MTSLSVNKEPLIFYEIGGLVELGGGGGMWKKCEKLMHTRLKARVYTRKWEENKAFWSEKIKSLLEQLGLGDLWMKAHYGDTGIVNIIRQRLKDIEL